MAYASVIRGVPREIALRGINKQKVEATDIAHAMQCALVPWPWDQMSGDLQGCRSRRRISRSEIRAWLDLVEARTSSRMIAAVLNDEQRVARYPTLLDDRAETKDICMSIPTIIGSTGLRRLLLPYLFIEERDALPTSGIHLRDVACWLG